MSINSKSVLITIYIHPGYYPPTLNLIRCLSSDFEKVTILTRNLLQSDWVYPSNVKVIEVGPPITLRQSESLNLFSKFFSFCRYCFALAHELMKHSYSWIILCDPIPTLAFRILRPYINSSIRIWYHNHDVSELNILRKYSIGWFAHFSEKAMFRYFDLFTIPTHDRKKYFPFVELKGQYMVLPNYPSSEFFKDFSHTKLSIKKLHILFQGSLGEGHGIESILELFSVESFKINCVLVLVGKGDINYITKLLNIVDDFGFGDRFEYLGFYPSYSDLLSVTASCHIGIGIYTGHDIMNITLGTASNKIYEYAALGLPVLVYDTVYWRNLLGRYDWCFFTDLTPASLIEQISIIESNYEKFSQSARMSFEQELNFEFYYRHLSVILI
jgi:glycosyltransferase involved in cell wall biosynthesis